MEKEGSSTASAASAESMDIDSEIATHTPIIYTKAEKGKQKVKATRGGVQRGKVATKGGAMEAETKDGEEKIGRQKAKAKAAR